MNHYIEIGLLPDPEFPNELLMSTLIQKLHSLLVKLGAHDIGLSWPEYVQAPQPAQRTPKRLGQSLRLHGTHASLAALLQADGAHDLARSLGGLRDHLQISPVLPVPARVVHRNFTRVQAKSSVERLRRRRMKRHNLSAEAARECLPDSVSERISEPFVNLHSTTTGHSFPLFIRMGPLQDLPRTGNFNCYGLSTQATVPWF